MKTLSNSRKISYWIALIAVFVTGISIAQVRVSPKIKPEEVPPEVQKIIDETMSGKYGLSGFEGEKISMGFDSSTKLSDLKAGEPVPVYKLYYDSLLKNNETVPTSATIKRIDVWEIPLLLKDKCITTFEVEKDPRSHQWRWGIFNGCLKGHYDDWQKVREAWPKSAGYNPVIVHFAWKKYFHVPEINDSNLTPLSRPSYDSLSMAIDTSYKVLVSSKTTLKYLKAHLPARRTGGTK
jgi:hypothetical protein